jgi:hypothetical protein
VLCFDLGCPQPSLAYEQLQDLIQTCSRCVPDPYVPTLSVSASLQGPPLTPNQWLLLLLLLLLRNPQQC